MTYFRPADTSGIGDVLGTPNDESLMADVDGGTLSARLRGTNKMLRDVYDQTNHRLNVAITTAVEVANDSGNPLPVSGSVSVSNLPATQVVSGSVEVANDSGNPLPVSGTVAVSNLPATQPVSGSVSVSNLPATQPVSGTFWQATQPVSGTVAVNNFPATQPVSATSLPLPTGASTSALQTTGNTSLASVDTKLTGVATAANQAAEQTTLGNIHTRLTEIKAKTDNLDVLLSSRTKPADSQLVTVNSWPATNCIPVQSAIGGISLASAGVGYVLAAVRKKSTEAATLVRIRCYEGTIKTNDQIKFSLVLNPTYAGVLTFADVANAPIQSVVGSVTNVLLTGRELDCTYTSLNMNNRAMVDNLLARLVSTSDVIALVGTPALGTAAVNVTAYMAVEWVP